MSKAIPKLRFKEFKDEWKKQLLGDTCVVNTGSKDTQNRVDQGLYPFYVRSNTVERINSYSFDGEAILTSGDGVGVGKNFHYVNGKFDYHQRVYALIAFKAEYSGKFIYHVFTEKFYKRVIKLSAKNSVDSVRMGMITEMPIAFPSLPEQQKIASFLSSVDEKLQQLTRKKELLEQYKKGVMQQLFSGKLRFKDENGKAFTEWEERRLGDVGEIVSGLTYSPEDVHEDGVLVLRSSNVQERKLTFDNNVFVNVQAGDFNPVMEDDILICVRNGSKDLIGKNAIIDKKSEGVAFGAFMTVFRSKSNKYLFHFLDTDTYKKSIHRNLGATINSINGSDLKKMKVPFPSEPEQQKIASFLSAIDIKIESVANQITLTQTFKKGLLQQMFV